MPSGDTPLEKKGKKMSIEDVSPANYVLLPVPLTLLQLKVSLVLMAQEGQLDTTLT